jgi:hypothetical protein
MEIMGGMLVVVVAELVAGGPLLAEADALDPRAASREASWSPVTQMGVPSDLVTQSVLAKLKQFPTPFQ